MVAKLEVVFGIAGSEVSLGGQQGYLLSEDFKEFVEEEEVLTLEFIEGASPWALKID